MSCEGQSKPLTGWTRESLYRQSDGHQEDKALLKPRSSNSCGTYFGSSNSCGTYFGTYVRCARKSPSMMQRVVKVGPSRSQGGFESLYIDNLMVITTTKAYSNLVLQIRVAPIAAPIAANSCGTYCCTYC